MVTKKVNKVNLNVENLGKGIWVLRNYSRDLRFIAFHSPNIYSFFKTHDGAKAWLARFKKEKSDDF